MKCLIAAWALLPMALAAAPAALENPQPGQAVAGVGLISGWHCDTARLEFRVDGAPAEFIPSGSSRPDTAGVCGGKTSTGFGYLLRWNNFTAGAHTLVLLADGVEFARAPFTVVDMGPTMIPPVDRRLQVNHFPEYGRSLVLAWNAASQSFNAVEARFDAPGLAGEWFGSDLERRSGCAHAENDGNHGTWARYEITFGGSAFSIDQFSANGATCSYSGTYATPSLALQGRYSCSDGKTGDFSSSDVLVTAREFSLQLAIRLSGSETCAIDATVGGSRY